MPGDYVATILSELLLVPYVVWGVYMLSQRYRYHYEAAPVVEAITLLCVLIFMAVEISLFKSWMRNNTLLYVFSLLGLIVSMAALYGHMAISFTSWLIVESISAGDDSIPDAPRLGPVEALERQRDFEGALNECLVIARIYPRDPSVHLHMAENLLNLSRPGEAAGALERALRFVEEPEKNLQIMNRLCEVLTRDLKEPERAVDAMRQYLKKFPRTTYEESLNNRIDAINNPVTWKAPQELASMEEMPVEEEPEEVIVQETSHIPLEPLENLADNSLELPAEDDPAPEPSLSHHLHLSLSALDDAPLEDIEEEEIRPAHPHIGLQALDDAPLEDPEEAQKQG